jgi:sialate O-acetylesterase
MIRSSDRVNADRIREYVALRKTPLNAHVSRPSANLFRSNWRFLTMWARVDRMGPERPDAAHRAFHSGAALSMELPLSARHYAILLGTIAAALPNASLLRAQGFAAQDQVQLKEPSAHRVYQRDRVDRAEIRIVAATGELAALETANVYRIGANGGLSNVVEGTSITANTVKGVPTGGPYHIYVKWRDGKSATVAPVFVGDLWVLAGQSNMEGVGDLINVAPPNPRVMSLGMDGKWVQAAEPLHWLVDSPDPVHSGNSDDRERRSEEYHKTRTKGSGLGLPFATAMVQATGVPIGLIPCAHGGTRMDQWDPSRKDEGGQSLYGSMMRSILLAGGKVKGVLWYQGESDADTDRTAAYAQVFADFIAAVRSDLGRPDLPFYAVQIGRVVRDGDPKPWNAVQDAQRLLPDRVGNTAVVSVIDLELDDLIHVGTQGLKRAGQRLARVAQHELFGKPGGYTPTFDRVSRGEGNTLVVRFKGVNSPVPGSGSEGYGLQPARHIAGFSIRKENGAEVPIVYEAMVGPSKDTVVLKLTGKPPAGARLSYGWGFDPYCNLTDSLDMAVPVFGPISLDDIK